MSNALVIPRRFTPNMTRRLLALALVLAALVSACSLSSGSGDLALVRARDEPVAKAAQAPPQPAPKAAAKPAPKPTAAPPPPTTAAPAPKPTAPPATAAPAPVQAAALGGVGAFTLQPYEGLGAWIDVYDWSATYTNGNPPLQLADIDRMAGLGVQTLYVQASKWDSPTDVLEPDRLLRFTKRARARGIAVVGWYLPTLEDVGMDLRRLLAIAALPIDGIAVDIESTKVGDIRERNRRIIELSTALRRELPGRAIGAIPLDPVLMETINPRYWPAFPWGELKPMYDVWMPMAYWTNRTESSGWRDGYRYIAENIDRIRRNLGQADVPVHPIGGIADRSTPEQVDGMLRASVERHALGGSLYDYRTTHDALWHPLQGFRSANRR
jgi:hypothetical protein